VCTYVLMLHRTRKVKCKHINKILLKHRVRPVSSRITSQCTFKVTWTFRGPCQLFVLPRSISCADRKHPKFVQTLKCFFMDDERYCVSHGVQCRICYIVICLNQQGIRRVVFYFFIFIGQVIDFTMVLPGRDYFYCTAFKWSNQIATDIR
jgi:hypothetical protein